MTPLRDALEQLPEAVFADLLASPEAYRLVIDLPGVSPSALDVTVRGGRLVVEGRREKAVPDGATYRREQRPVFPTLELPLPPDAAVSDGTGAEPTATLDRGVLTVTLPRSSAGTRIAVEG